MASIKDLKKDINFLTNEVIETCIIKLSFNPGIDNKRMFDIIDEFVEYRNQTIYKINNPEKLNGNKKEALKAYYNELMEAFIAKVNQAFEKINSIQEQPSK
ncbi:MAG: hypothetical protein KGZ97_00650 [Bacteroidetes bacterium]|nr:hypothetical protein [Bacteroidota bacterium]